MFQRRPNWCAPLHNSQITPEEMADIRSRYDEIFARCAETPGGFIHGPDRRKLADVPRRGALRLLGEALRLARLRDLARQLPGRADGRGGQRRVHGLHRRQDPGAGQGPGGGREADPHRPRVRHPAGTDGDPLLRGLQPGQRAADRRQRHPDRADHGQGASRRRTPSTSSTSSSTPPGSTPSPAPSTGSTSSASTAGSCATSGPTTPSPTWACQAEGFPNLVTLAGPTGGSVSTNFPRGIETGVDWATDLVPPRSWSTATAGWSPPPRPRTSGPST